VVAVVDIQTALLMQVKVLGPKRIRSSTGPTASAIAIRLRSMKGDPALIVVLDDVLDVKAAIVLAVEEELRSKWFTRKKWVSQDAAAVVRTRVREICGAADLIIAISDEDREHFTRLTAGLGTRNHRGGTAVSVMVPYVPDPNSARFDHRLELEPGPDHGSPPTAFVVGSPHAVALASMVWFFVNVWPTVRARVPALTYVVAGSNWRTRLDLVFADVDKGQFGPGVPHRGVDWESIGIKLVGRLSSHEVEALYGNATVYVAPHRLPELRLRAGAAADAAPRVSHQRRRKVAVALSAAPLSNFSSGCSTKVIDAMGRGLAVVTNSQGAIGVGGRGTARGCIRAPERGKGEQQEACALYATDNVELMAEIIVEMVNCDRCRRAVEAAATRHIATVLSLGRQQSLFNHAVTGTFRPPWADGRHGDAEDPDRTTMAAAMSGPT